MHDRRICEWFFDHALAGRVWLEQVVVGDAEEEDDDGERRGRRHQDSDDEEEDDDALEARREKLRALAKARAAQQDEVSLNIV